MSTVHHCPSLEVRFCSRPLGEAKNLKLALAVVNL